MERVVKRIELRSESSLCSTPTPEPEVIKRNLELEFVTYHPPEPTGCSDLDAGLHNDDGFDFRLFANRGNIPGLKNCASPARIRLQSPPPIQAELGFVQPDRPQSYYFTEQKSESHLAALDIAAVTGEEVRARSKTPWPGASYGWKVVPLLASKVREDPDSLEASAEREDEEPALRRRRLGKKARVKMRTKIAMIKAQQEQDRKAVEHSENLEREKRTRRNREKKVKRKAREKGKKAAMLQEKHDMGFTPLV